MCFAYVASAAAFCLNAAQGAPDNKPAPLYSSVNLTDKTLMYSVNETIGGNSLGYNVLLCGSCQIMSNLDSTDQ